LPAKKLKKPVKKTTATPLKKAPAKKVISKAKKPAAAKTAVKKAPIKKPTVKKAVAKKIAAKKPVVKKVVSKKPVAKKVTVKKTVTAKKAPVKAVAKKTTAKVVKKPVVAKKAVSKAPVKKVEKKIVQPKSKGTVAKAEKKPLAQAHKSGVKPTPVAAREITLIKATPAPAPRPHSTTDVKANMTIPVVPANYEPTDTEEFMNPVMKEYFRQRLLSWRDELLRESGETLHTLHEEGNMQKPDITDRASEETDLAIEFRTRDRERKLINKIGEALQRIEDGSYGYCEETGDPIPVKRLIAYPKVTMTVEAQELHERRERTQRDQYE
jgi:DnaK suppressor protein